MKVGYYQNVKFVIFRTLKMLSNHWLESLLVLIFKYIRVVTLFCHRIFLRL